MNRLKVMPSSIRSPQGGHAVAAILCTLLVWLPLDNAHAVQPKVGEYQLKARYLNGFTKFIEWPEGTFDKKPLRICVVGANPFGGALDAIVHKHNGHKTRQSATQEVKYLSRSGNMNDCHLLYISDSEESYANRILAKVEGKSVLTVSSIDRFTVNGGMIQLYVRDYNVRFVISPRALRRADLEANANLLRAADVTQ